LSSLDSKKELEEYLLGKKNTNLPRSFMNVRASDQHGGLKEMLVSEEVIDHSKTQKLI
jgi:hypothetical protein